MPIPDMPSLGKLYRPWNAPVLIANDVPCRLVPVTWGGRARYSGIDDVEFSHYADVPGSLDVQGVLNATATKGLQYSFLEGIGDAFVVCAAHPRSVFHVLIVEDRYLDTPDHYKRLYLWRVASTNFAPHPCV